MDFMQAREMIRLRYQLRQLLSERRHQEARPLLERFRLLATAHEEERPLLESEIARWECHFDPPPAALAR